MNRVVGIGAGGHAKVVIEILRLMRDVEIVGLLDVKRELWGTRVLDVPVLGDDGRLPELYDDGVRSVFVGVGSIGEAGPRRRLYETALAGGFSPVAAVHPRAILSDSARIGRGPTIMAGAVVNAAAVLGDNVIVNTAAVVEHDCVIGDHVHIAVGAALASGVVVGEGSLIGVGAAVLQSCRIGRNAVVGAGAAVVEDVPDGAVVVGVPARMVSRKS